MTLMTPRSLTPIAVLLAASLSGPRAVEAETFKVEKFDIKGEGGTDYVAVGSATGRVFVSRGTHMMVVEGATPEYTANGTSVTHANRKMRVKMW